MYADARPFIYVCGREAIHIRMRARGHGRMYEYAARNAADCS